MERIPFEKLPPKVKYAIITLFSAWGFFILGQAFVYGRISFILSTAGIFCCAIVYSLRNWGRIVSILMNLFIVGAHLINFYNFGKEGVPVSGPGLMALGNIALFSVATWFLLTGETSRFFKKGQKPPEGRRGMT